MINQKRKLNTFKNLDDKKDTLRVINNRVKKEERLRKGLADDIESETEKVAELNENVAFTTDRVDDLISAKEKQAVIDAAKSAKGDPDPYKNKKVAVKEKPVVANKTPKKKLTLSEANARMS